MFVRSFVRLFHTRVHMCRVESFFSHFDGYQDIRALLSYEVSIVPSSVLTVATPWDRCDGEPLLDGDLRKLAAPPVKLVRAPEGANLGPGGEGMGRMRTCSRGGGRRPGTGA